MSGNGTSRILADGPWTHREISANGIRLHIAEAGKGPLVVLLHGFPQNWWMWRHLIPRLADAGYHVVAPDLRGFGASDKPPRSYDLMTVSGDVGGLIRALGAREATVIGHDIGGLVAWTTAALHPGVVRGLGAVSAPHPRRLRRELISSNAQRRALAHAFAYQLPRVPESQLTSDNGAEVREIMRKWTGPDWAHTTDFAYATEVYRQAMCVPQAAYGAAEYFRWMMRSLARPDGARFAKSLAVRIDVPVLQLQGWLDPVLLPQTSDGSSAYVAGPYESHYFDNLGHFLPEEDPETVGALIEEWLLTL
ncbi:pimeloyl-ACP methyl ester carboxylesterase [Antricoccus suffuscus]|uniref:Pimeloyl-ACP methyl ester carboxylesterase n=1 Tax=Antricoccus suffuscus TaxID=1629062 RepID=A0A2T1A3D1_9ACTN|nr:alpha/beta hydrolase [Antricoccus suffuscus]PRZ43096.1 pimeloyl-ACP methyl ester carboxylesterase [Antricoccus suffuscus]